MKELPLSASDYKNAVLLCDFVSEAREAVKKIGAEDVLFQPEIKGYTILYKTSGKNMKISLEVKKGFFSGRKLLVKVYRGGKLTEGLCCRDLTDNKKAVSRIFNM